MPTFMHLTSSNRISLIRRGGIKRGRWGLFCMPVVPVYYVSHQWARELRRTGQRLMVAVYFWLPDDEQVWVATTPSSTVSALPLRPPGRSWTPQIPRATK